MPVEPRKPLSKHTKKELIELFEFANSELGRVEAVAQNRDQHISQQRVRIAGLEGEVQVLGALSNDLTELVETAVAHGETVFHWEPSDFNDRAHAKQVRQQREQLRDVHQRAERQRQRNHERLGMPQPQAMTPMGEEPPMDDGLVSEARVIKLDE